MALTSDGRFALTLDSRERTRLRLLPLGDGKRPTFPPADSSISGPATSRMAAAFSRWPTSRVAHSACMCNRQQASRFRSRRPPSSATPPSHLTGPRSPSFPQMGSWSSLPPSKVARAAFCLRLRRWPRCSGLETIGSTFNSSVPIRRFQPGSLASTSRPDTSSRGGTLPLLIRSVSTPSPRSCFPKTRAPWSSTTAGFSPSSSSLSPPLVRSGDNTSRGGRLRRYPQMTARPLTACCAFLYLGAFGQDVGAAFRR